MFNRLSRSEWGIIILATGLCLLSMSSYLQLPGVKPGHNFQSLFLIVTPPIIYSVLTFAYIEIMRWFDGSSKQTGAVVAGIWSFFYAMIITVMCPLLIKSSFVDITPLKELPEVGILFFMLSLPSSLIPVYLFEGFDSIDNLFSASIILFIVGYIQLFCLGWFLGWSSNLKSKNNKSQMS